MMFNYKAAASLVFFIFFLTVSAPAQDQNTQSVGQQMDNFSLSGFSEKGKKNWDLSGKSADIDSDVIKLKTVESNLYGENEDVKVTASTGDFNRKAGDLHLEKDVVITTTSGAKLTTDSLDWNRKSQVVSTEKQVNIQKQDLNISAQGAKAYPSLDKVDLEKDVVVSVDEPVAADQQKKDKIIIVCDGPLQMDFSKNIATFNKNVKVETQEAVMQSDLMEVFFVSDKEKDVKINENAEFSGSKIEKIVATGNVRITRDKNVSYSDKAVYSAIDKTIVLMGSPRLVVYSKEQIDASIGN